MKPTLLIVDDNEDLRAVAREALCSEGYRVHAVARAEAALRFLEEDGKDVDLLLTSVFLPGMTGIDLADQLRAQGRTLRIVLSSSQATEPELKHRLARGDVEFLARPFSLNRLTDKVGRSLQDPKPRVALPEEPPPEDVPGSSPVPVGFLRRLLARHAGS